MSSSTSVADSVRVSVDCCCRNTNMWHVEEGCGCSEVVVPSGRSATTTSLDVGCGFVHESLTFAKRF